MIQLSDEQTGAINSILDFYKNSEELGFSLTGQAGTGKSTVINQLCNLLDQSYIPYVLCAPTHKAALVVQRLSGRGALTLHKLLSLTPNIEIFDLDFKELQFRVSSKQMNIPYGGLIICDEASMVNDDLFKLLMLKAEQNKSKVLFISDKAQLAPVKSRQISLVYNLKNQYNLTKIYRQSSESALIDPLQALRSNSISHFDTHIGEKGSIICTSDLGQFLKMSSEGIKKAIQKSDILEAKILTYTNARTQAYNTNIRKLIWQDEQQYHKLEFLTGYENLEYGSGTFFNSMDYVIVTDPVKNDIYIPEFGILPGYTFDLYDSLTDMSSPISIIDKEISQDYLTALAELIETVRLNAINHPDKRAANKIWSLYYKINSSFTTPVDLMYQNRVIKKKSFDYGYAMTSHKSQGSSINNIYIDMKDINRCSDDEVRRQLQYVALSRTRNNVYIFQ